MTAVTIREPAVDTAIELKKKGIGPDRILMMVSTDPEHHFANSGTTLTQYWKEAERCIKKAADVGIKMCGTVSTIWGSPITGATKLEDAVEFTKRWFSIGAHDIEHADHDGSANAAEVYRYFSMILDAMPNPEAHLCHLHETKRIASPSILAALQAGITRFEGTLGGLGGQPANFLDDCPIRGTGEYYYRSPVSWGSSPWKTSWSRSTSWASSTATTWTASSGSAGRWKRRSAAGSVPRPFTTVGRRKAAILNLAVPASRSSSRRWARSPARELRPMDGRGQFFPSPGGRKPGRSS